MLFVIKLLGSLKFAIFLIASLAVLLIASTLTESAYGTPFAQKVFYQAGWFDLFLSLLWVNVFCSTILRYPFKKNHAGFLVTHIGILTLLIGALLSRLFGVEGQMPLHEGEHKRSILQENYVLHAVFPNRREPVSTELKLKNGLKPFSVPVKNHDFNVRIHKALEQAVEAPIVSEEDKEAPINHAVQVTLASQTVGLNETLWLIENDPRDPHSFFSSIGPAHLELKVLKEKENPQQPQLRLLNKSGQEIFSLFLTAEILAHWQTGTSAETFAIPSSDLILSHFRYFPNAKVSNNQLVNASTTEVPFNPALEFEVSDSQGRKEQHTRFSLFPQFDSLHGKQTSNFFHLNTYLNIPIPENLQPASSPSLVFSVSPEEQWTYRAASSKGSVIEGVVQPNTPIPAGWMDITFTVQQTLKRAVISRQIVEDRGKGELAAEISVIQQGTPDQKQWILLNQPVSLQTNSGPVEVTLTAKSLALPFLLQLIDFRKVDYPGTQNAASFESDVLLYDMKQKISIQKTISMNKPMDYAGFRIFQSSYIQDPSMGEGSVFTIAKNPGIAFIYTGAVTLFSGVILLFYIKPFSTQTLQKEETRNVTS